ncbi:MAG: hypothetical protein LC647_06475, partial [Beggiatoa sp.]|nr:hypothetical protein [Beggiatoa sp.]
AGPATSDPQEPAGQEDTLSHSDQMADADPVAPWMRPDSKNINIGGGDTAVTEMSLPPPQAKLSSSVPTHGSVSL